METTRQAGAYRTGDAILIHAVALTDAGVGVYVPPVFRLKTDAGPAELGAAVRTALQQNPPLIPHPARNGWKAVTDGFLKAAGARSWRRLESGAVHCWIAAVRGTIRFTPLANGGTQGPRKGFQPFGAPEVTALESDRDGLLGEALIRTLAACR